MVVVLQRTVVISPLPCHKISPVEQIPLMLVGVRSDTN